MQPLIRILSHAGWILAVTATVCCQPKPAEAQPKPPKLDKLARQTLQKWGTLRYHLEGAGVKTLSFDITVISKGGMTGTWNAKGSYSIGNDSKKPHGKLAWEDKEVASAMQRRGWTSRAFSKDVRKNSDMMELANATVTSHPSRGRTILIVKGGKTKEDRLLLYDSAGVQVGEIVGPMKKRVNYEIYRGKYLRIGESYQMPETQAELKISHATFGGILVPTRMTEVVRIRKQLLSDLTMVFSNHLINGKKAAAQPIKKSKKPSVPPKGVKPGSKQKGGDSQAGK
ncbi:MAG: hypothetical protein VX951_05325 [Planctomycetota bacterium]|nr:hypothetical protein [Planctomycetota bacterium]